MKPLPPTDLREVLESCRGDFLCLRGARVFITGGTGFFGKWLVESLVAAKRELLDRQLDICILARDPAGAKEAYRHSFDTDHVNFHYGDVQDFVAPAGSFSHVIHAATPARASYNQRNPMGMWDVNVRGTRRVLEFASTAGVERLLFTSSGAIYGTQPPDLSNVPEDFPGCVDPMDPKNVYAIGKLAAEHLCRLFQSRTLAIGIARCFAFVGPALPLDAHFAVGNFVRDGLAGRDIMVHSDGRVVRSYQYPTDLVRSLLAIWMRGASSVPYNVGSPTAYSLGEVARVVAAYTGAAVRILGEANGNLPPRYVPDTRRIESNLVGTKRVPLEEAVRRTIAWNR